MWITILFIISSAILISVTNGNLQDNNFIRARIQDHPYQVSIQYKNYHICGGAIISEWHILSAATCLTHDKTNVLYGNLKVISGTDNLEKLDYISSSINDVEYVILHEKFDLKNQRNNVMHDIGILQLMKPLSFSLYRWVVSSPFDYKLSTNIGNAYVTGWGKNLYAAAENSAIINPRLQFISVEILDPLECYHIYKTKQHCLIALDTSFRQGNGGSPIMKDNSNTTVGIVSVVSINAEQPTIYTKIHKYVGWIITSMEKM